MRSERFAVALASWGGCGFVPAAPGTVASAVAVGLAYALTEGLGLAAGWLAALSLALVAPAIWSAGVASAHFGREDPPQVVIDEVVGQWLALAAVNPTDWKQWLAAFVLFRGLDIAKPFPLRRLERLPGGWGIVADDVAAGLCVMIVLVVLARLGYA